MYLPFMPRWKVERLEHLGEARNATYYWRTDCGANYRRSDAEERAAYLSEMTGHKHRVIDRKQTR